MCTFPNIYERMLNVREVIYLHLIFVERSTYKSNDVNIQASVHIFIFARHFNTFPFNLEVLYDMLIIIKYK